MGRQGMMIKNIWNEKKKIILAVFAFLVTGIAIAGVTIAYFKSQTNQLTNTFALGIVTTEIEETIGDGQKEPYVRNTGKNDCIVRMRFSVSPSDAAVRLLDGGKEFDASAGSAKWRYDSSDDFYYYQGILEPGKKTEVPLFTGYEITEEDLEEFVPFNIILYQEAIQSKAKIINDQNEKITLTAYDDNQVYVQEKAKQIWNEYDQK